MKNNTFKNFLDSRNKKNNPKDKNQKGKIKPNTKIGKMNRKPSVQNWDAIKLFNSQLCKII